MNRRQCLRLGAASLLWTGCNAAVVSPAAAAIAPIRRIIVHLHANVADRAFMTPLTARLGHELVPPIELQTTDLDLAPVRGWTGKLDAAALLELVARHLDPASARGQIHILLIREDMAGPGARFNFAFSHGGPDSDYRLIAVSLSRLAAPDPDLTAARVARMILKNVARTAGLSGSDACVMGFPRSLAELDAMPESFCGEDRAALAAAGLVRA